MTNKTIKGGRVIVFEGLDGVGKTTQLQHAYEALQKASYAVTVSRNLGGTPIGEALRHVVLSDIDRSPSADLYISVAIQTALAEELARLRAQGHIVLLDRGPLSMAAYHLYGNGVDKAFGWPHVETGMQQFAPELTVLYELAVDAALERAKRRHPHSDYYESKPATFFEQVAAGYRQAAQRFPVKTIDASQSIEAIHQQTMTLIESVL